MIHASAGIAHTMADFYLRLARGTADQRAAAEDWMTMLMNMKEEPAV